MKIKAISFLTIILVLNNLPAFSQASSQLVNTARKSNEREIIKEYLQFLSIPNVTNDTPNILKNVDFIKQMLSKRGIPSTIINTKGNPVVYGEIKAPGATKTIIFYAHYDGQPVNVKQWHQGLEPFKPVFITAPFEQNGKIVSYNEGDTVSEHWRISGRGSADDKAGIMMILNAYDALLKAGGKPSVNIKLFFEGEEEKGSPNLEELLATNRLLLTSDAWVIIDGPRHPTGKKLLSFGVRGDVNMRLTIYGPKRPLHSGNFGNWAPNPGQWLASLLAGMKDDHGHVLIKGFYDDVKPFSLAEMNAINKIPKVEQLLQAELLINDPDGERKPFIQLLNEPSLNINGMQSGNVGEMASNQIPPKAEAVLDLRLVPGNDYLRQIEKVTAYIRSKGYFIVDHEPTTEEKLQHPRVIKITHDAGYNAQRTPLDLPIAQNIASAIQTTIDYPLLLIPGTGGSLPLYIFEKQLHANLVTLPLVNYDNNQHAENENMRIDYLWEGIVTIAAVMQMK